MVISNGRTKTQSLYPLQVMAMRNNSQDLGVEESLKASAESATIGTSEFCVKVLLPLAMCSRTLVFSTVALIRWCLPILGNWWLR